MKKILLASLILFGYTLDTNAATRRTNGSGGGNWTDASTFACNCIPSSTDDVILEGNDVLTVDTSITVDDFRYEYSDDVSRLVINLGDTLTITDDFIFDEPSNSDATANVEINGALVIGTGSTNDMRIFLSNNEDNLTVNLTVNGFLDIAGRFSHASGALSTNNIINLTVNGRFDISGDFSSAFASNSCQFNFVNDGDVNAGTITIEGSGTNSLFNLTTQASSTFDAGQLTLFAKGDNSKVIVDHSGSIALSRTRFFSQTNTDSIMLICRNGSSYTNSSFVAIRNTAGVNNLLHIQIDNGASFSTSDYIRCGTTDDGVVNIDVDGTLSLTNDFRFDVTDNTTGTFDMASTGRITCNGMNFDFAGNNNFDLVSNGKITSSGDIDFTASDADDVNITFNDAISVTGGRYFQSTTGANSSVRTLVRDSLTCLRLRYDVNTTASGADNEVDINGSNVVLTLTDINFNGVGSGTLTSGSLNNSTVIFTGSATGDSIPVRSSVEYDNIVVRKTGAGGIDLLGTLNSTNFHGNLIITGGAELELGASAAVTVPGNFSNSGTFDDGGNGMSVTGNFTNSSVFNNNGSIITVGGTLTNTGTFNNLINVRKIDVTGGFTNNGTMDADIDSLVVGGNFSNTATYTSDGNNIYLSGNWSNTGTYTFTDGDIITFQGNTNQAITGTTTMDEVLINNTSGGVDINSGTTSIKTLLTINSGALDTKGNMVFLSDATETAALAEITGGSITGNVTVQRFMSEGAGWYLLASPVTGSTIADWNAEMPMSGFVGSDEEANPFTSVYQYDETTRGGTGDIDSGYVAATNTTNSLVPGEGWFVYFDAVKSGATAGTMDVTGPLQTGTVSLTGLSLTGTGPAGENGWHMLGNPYASPVEWDLVTKTNIVNNTAYVMGASGNYSDVVNDNVDFLYSSEAFWVEIDPVFPLPFVGSVVFNENDKAVRADDYNAKEKPSPFKNPLKMQLTMASDTGYMDYSVLRFADNPDFTKDFDFVEDGDSRKLGNALGIYPNISSFSSTDNSDVYYNTLSSLDSSDVIPIRIWKRFPSNKIETFNVTFNGIEAWERNNKCLILTDLVSNDTEKISSNNDEYSFMALDTLKAPRLELSLTTPLDVSSNNASCFGYNDGKAVVKGDGVGNHNYTWVDQNGNLILKETDKAGASTADNLAPGEYTVWVTDNGVCGTVGATVMIEEPDPIIAEFDADEDTVFMNVNSTIYFTNSSINASDYAWDFGDGSTSNDSEPAHTYTSGGVFEVMMVASQDKCSDTLFKTIVVINNVGIDNPLAEDEAIRIYQADNQTFVSFNLKSLQNATITMHDVMGRAVMEPLNMSSVQNQKVQLDLPNDLFGIYTISVYVDNDKLSKKLYYTRR